MNKNLLLLSSSREGNTEYLSHAKPMINDHLKGITEVLFIPYAGVSISYDEYTERVQSALSDCQITIVGIHQCADPIAAVKEAKAIAVGGGNTFHLLHQLYQHKLVKEIQTRVNDGCPYIGWSAGSNIAGMSIKTTNDMPIIQPKSFDALNLVPIQLNPHYTDFNPPGHNGETREQRLQEFMVLNPTTYVIGIQEGSALKMQNNHLRLIGGKQGFVFKAGDKTTVEDQSDLSHLLP
ncbi:dipeptidase PepE [Thalassotalea aquiviva]|uniref:dipeptidase PepE n=1 Tax=Thalassotalea aquiviva TaxID=3242415 RepID=UPI00352BBDE2